MGIATIAYIDDAQYVRGACGRYSCETDIRYYVQFRLANGQEHAATTQVREADAKRHNISTNIVVYYLPENPSDIVNDISAPDAAYPIVSSAVGLIAVIFFGILAYNTAKRAKTAKS